MLRNRIFSMLLSVVASVIASSSPAMADDAEWKDPASMGSRNPGFYVRNSIGANFLDSISLKDRSNGVDSSQGVSLDLDAGFAWGIDLGWRVSDLLSVEISSGIMYNKIDSVSGTVTVGGTTVSGSTSLSGDFLQIPILAGIGFDIPLVRSPSSSESGGGVYLRLAASAGGLFVRGSLDDLGTIISAGSDNDFTWAYALTAAVDWEVGSGFLIGASYRYLGTGSMSFSAFGVPDLLSTSGVGNHQVMGTISLTF
jgi:opacity protein-like surface antigen